MQIKNIIFDLGGVILEDHFPIAAEKIVEVYPNINIDELITTFHKNDLDVYHTGQKSYEQRWQAILQEINHPELDIDLLRKIHEDIFQPVPGTIEIVRKLSQNYPLYLLSNQIEALMPNLRTKYDFFELFQFQAVSYEANLCKPNLDFYQYFLDKTKINPEESIFIDNSQKNLDPATSLGIKTILFKNAQQLLNELELHEIKIGA